MSPAHRKSDAGAAPSLEKPASKLTRGVDVTQAASSFTAYDETLLDVCRTRWQFGDWTRLAAIDLEVLLHHPDRSKIALLVASAHFQLDRRHQAHRLLQLALDWGASLKQAVQMLISGTHQSLAEAHLLINHPEPAREHFREAIRNGGVPGDSDLLAEARALRSNSSAT